MKANASTLILALCMTAVTSQAALPLTFEAGARTLAAVRADDSAGGSELLESLVPRDGLEFYFEIRSGGLAQLAQSATSLQPIVKVLLPDTKASNSELTAWLIRNLAVLSRSRIALAGYGSGGAAALIQAASSAEAESLKEDLVRLTASRGAPVAVSIRGRAVVAGAAPAVSKLTSSDAGPTLSDDQGFLTAQARFAEDPFFAFIEITGPMQWARLGGAEQNAVAVASLMAALHSMPYAIAIGGSIEGEATSVRALLLYSRNQNQNPRSGLFSSIISAANSGQPSAAGFASADTDLFIDIMLDWEKLYEGIEALVGAFTYQPGGAAQGSGTPSSDLFAMLEASLGFSIKNDLIPTLGNELAFTVDGIDRFIPRQAGAELGRAQAESVKRPTLPSSSRRAVGSPSPRFLLLIALRDSAKFEKLIAQLLAKASRGSSQPVGRMLYRGATINYKGSVAYAVSGGFFILGSAASEVRRALDAQATGASLASSADFRAAMGAPRPVMVQAYVSGRLSGRLFEAIVGQAVKSPPEPSALSGLRASATPLGLVVTPDTEGVLIETRIPTNLAMLALASLGKSKPGSQGAGNGGDSGGSGAGVSRGPDGRRVPKLTTDDVRSRKP